LFEVVTQAYMLGQLQNRLNPLLLAAYIGLHHRGACCKRRCQQVWDRWLFQIDWGNGNQIFAKIISRIEAGKYDYRCNKTVTI